MAPSDELKLSKVSARGGSLIRLAGVIDTNFPRAELVGMATGVVVLDLDAVTRITSYGVREWLKTLREISCDYLSFVRCRPSLVMQFNLIAHFGGAGELLSFYLPYVCPSCGDYSEHLLEVRKHDADVKAFNPPPHPCPKCSAPLELDDLPQTYFAYAAKTRTPSPPPLVDALLSGTATAAVTVTPFALGKDVLDDLTVLRLSGQLDKSAQFKRVADGLEGNVVIDMQGLVSFTPEGLHRLGTLLAAQGPALFIARVQVPLLLELAKDPALCGSAQVTSVLFEAHCIKCESTTMCEVSPQLLAQGSPALPCPKCQHPLRVVADAATLEAVGRVRTAPPPVDVADYLEGRLADEVMGSTFGRYQLIRPIGMGGMAEVFLARLKAVAGFEKVVVLKRILPHLSNDERFVEMFLQEAKIAARVTHPNVVQIFDVGEVGGRYFIAMEYVRGWDLNVILRVCGRLGERIPIALSARIAADLCAGLFAAHTYADDGGKPKPIIHRDVSPHNVIVSAEGQTKIADFGIAKAADSSHQTPTNQFKGKLVYMAPEQGAGNGVVLDARADIFPVGLIFFQCLTLQHMFQRENDYTTMRAILEAPIPQVTQWLPDAPPLVQQILERALARDRDQRYPTAAAMREDLERLINQMGSSASTTDLAHWLDTRLPANEMSNSTEQQTYTYVRVTPTP